MGEGDRNYSQEIQGRIRELAHSMWEWAGRQQDMALHYWVAAEKEVLATMRTTAEKLMPGEKSQKAEQSVTEAAEPASSQAPEPDEAAGQTPVKTGRPKSPSLRRPSEREEEHERHRSHTEARSRSTRSTPDG